MPLAPIQVCFAVKEEAEPFRRKTGDTPGIRILITGMGRRNAEKSIEQALSLEKPLLVLSCGFAGGLDPALATGTVVAHSEPRFHEIFLGSGAQLGTFHCTERVATTAREKQTLRKLTGANAVEMESQTIVEICRRRGIAAATVRVILDTASEDLPLDFNSLMTAEQKMDFSRLAMQILKQPWKITSLMHLQRQSRAAATSLAGVLCQVVDRAEKSRKSFGTI